MMRTDIDECLDNALDQIRAHVALLGASHPHASYAVWVVNDKPDQRVAWLEHIRRGLAEHTWIAVFGTDGTTAHSIRGYSGLYVVWDAATAYVTPDEVKTQLALTFVNTMRMLKTMLPHHQLIIDTTVRPSPLESLERGDD